MATTTALAARSTSTWPSTLSRCSCSASTTPADWRSSPGLQVEAVLHAADVEQPPRLPFGAARDQPAAGPIGGVAGAHDRAQSRGVEEGDGGEVDDDATDRPRGHGAQRLIEQVCAREVDLAGDGHDRPGALLEDANSRGRVGCIHTLVTLRAGDRHAQMNARPRRRLEGQEANLRAAASSASRA